jgi:hypothetical protein
VRKSKRRRVECLALERNLKGRQAPRSVDGLADHWVADLGEVDADLMRTPRLKPASDLGREPTEFLDHFVVGNGANSLAGASGDAFAAISPVRHEWQIDRSTGWFDQSLDECNIEPFDRMGSEEHLERAKSRRRANQQDRAGRVSIKTLDDANVGASRVARASEISPSVLEQRAALARRSRLGQHSRRLVNNQDMAILIEDSQSTPQGFGAWPVGPERNRGVWLDLTPGLETGQARHVDAPTPDGFLRLPSRQPETRGDQFIQAQHL